MNNKGFTLAEVLIVIVLLTLCLIPLMGLFPIQVTHSRRSENFTKDMSLGQKKIEEIKSSLYTNFGSFPTGISSGNFSIEGFPNFNYTLEIGEEVASWLKIITLTVWPTGDPDDKLTLKTKAARRT